MYTSVGVCRVTATCYSSVPTVHPFERQFAAGARLREYLSYHAHTVSEHEAIKDIDLIHVILSHA